jgi:hypothetical protein
VGVPLKCVIRERGVTPHAGSLHDRGDRSISGGVEFVCVMCSDLKRTASYEEEAFIAKVRCGEKAC